LRVITVTAVGASTRSWVVDQDCVLLDANSTGLQFVISQNPSLVLTDITGAGADTVRDDVIMFGATSASSAAARPPSFPLKFPLSKDSTLYVAVSTGGCVFLYLDSVEPQQP